MDFKQRYILAKKNGLAEIFRGDEISRLIAEKYPQNAQIALLMNTVMQLLAGNKPDAEWNAYQAYREEAKAKVDALIAEIER